MKKLDIRRAKDSLEHYASVLNGGTLLLTRRGRPVAALVGFDGEMDDESAALSVNPRFLQILQESRESLAREGGIPHDEICRRFGITRRRTGSSSRAAASRGPGPRR